MEGHYIEGHNDLHKDTMMENPQILTSHDGCSNRNPTERCTGPLYFQGCPPKDPTIPHHYQDAEQKVKVKQEEEETYVRGNQQSIHEGDIMKTIKEEMFVKADLLSMEEGDTIRTTKKEEEEMGTRYWGHVRWTPCVTLRRYRGFLSITDCYTYA
ncbi:uncharacterized protein [Hyperolius riggenbachi]|uniref:uncharacterized protein isoform X2 n=1 Tax=Hyperolius riggenbachi TaxID=752182 RepID=UPI0035A2A27C